MLNRLAKYYSVRGYPSSLQAARHAIISYSQFGEDLLLQNFFGFFAEDLNYLDIGAYHPIVHSNSFLSYRKGGRGMAVEANPNLLNEWRNHRPRDVFLNMAVSPSESGRIYYYSNPAQPCLNFVDTQPLEKPGFCRHLINCISISDLANRYLELFDRLDFLSVDVEGLDADLIMGFPFAKIRPRAIVVEDYRSSETSVIERFLNGNHYRRFAQLRISKIFVDEHSP